MNLIEVLARLKYLVAKDQFCLLNRRARRAQAVTSALAKEIVKQLSIEDFRSFEEDRDRIGEYLWIFQTEYGEVYYLKFKFVENNQRVKFISFHLSN
ncbi:type II toxin-antitoxin system MqsR family toxin [Lactobacillus sp. ESL0679]|uniref:type II toxin-antitoxin system MqsR family toxin n=1 Tax=Lactobacillus sp. ESL0679 TaxID=2983209 RepID=UPI0023F7923F|nr:type II toxin-antitoxin system MqsR family toxin [Lactobacillus sp. ESL0679]MDF7683733.1 type II toxin-antitoxin system MqsR family toxin [Lactobacillus sp. ESL0679]